MKALLLAIFLLAPALTAAQGTDAARAPDAKGAAPAPDATDAIPAAQPRSFSSRAIPPVVQLGQPFVYEVVIEDAATIRYDLPRAPQLGTLQVRSASVQRVEQGDATTTTARLEVAIFDALGETPLPNLVFTVLGPEGVARLEVPGVPITVQGSAEGDELDGLRPPQAVQVFSALPLWIGAGVLGLGLVGFFGRRWLLARRASRPTEVAPAGTPEERALAALDALQAGGIADGRQFYFDLSAIVRTFLEEVTTLEAREMTTTELVDALVAREVPGLSLAQLGAWLERGDLHRFARAPVTAPGAEADLERAREIVRSVANAARPPAEEAA